MWAFVFDRDSDPVANWGGRFGAALSHILVYKGAGIASMVIGLAIGGIGLHVVYGNKMLPVLRYLRWVSILLLLVAPILTYLFPLSSFPLGGRLGTGAISYLNGFLGSMGTGMVLLSTVLFFVFVIFALDIRPFIDKMRMRARNVAKSLSVEPVFNEPQEAVAEQGAEPVAPIEEAEIAPAATANMVLADADEEGKWELTIREDEELDDVDNIEEEDEETEEQLEYQRFLEEKEAAALAAVKTKVTTEPEFSFEVIQQEEKPAIQHGAHISIASNEPYAPELDLPDYKFPTLDLLIDRATETISLDKEELEKNKNQIIQTLRSFGIEIQRISATVGPTVTLYEIVPAEGVRISKIRNLEDDIALNLAALGIRIIAPIPGRGTIGIEVPNANKQIVSMRTLISSEKFVNNKMSLPIALGKKIDNENYIVDLATMPHLLMAGATGQGKSVGINAILVSLLYKKHPSQLKFVMVDPKKVLPTPKR
jgi:S-DNA-T family DNA segregation ATPase FtsK/SpoIIIE